MKLCKGGLSGSCDRFGEPVWLLHGLSVVAACIQNAGEVVLFSGTQWFFGALGWRFGESASSIGAGSVNFPVKESRAGSVFHNPVLFSGL